MKINEIFYSIQGEGKFTGTPSIFIRFSGCNLKCKFCDTQHNSFKELTEEEIIEEVNRYEASHVVITGGEPFLQLTESLVDKLHRIGKFIQVETNGSIDNNLEVDWITCSPKFEYSKHAKLKLKYIDELKVVYQGQPMAIYSSIKAKLYYLQPCDLKDKITNSNILTQTINFIKRNPKWKLSLQTQKILKVR